MDDRMNDLRDLAVLDPARDREPTAMEWTRSQAHIERMMAAEARPRQTRRRWVLAGAAAVAAGVVGAVAVPALIPSSADQAVASWTAAPTSRTGAQVMPQARKCAGNQVGGGSTVATPEDVLLAEQRGKATLLVMRKGGSVIECLSVGADQFASMGLTDETTTPPQPARDGVTLETMSSVGEGRGMWSNIIGLAGPGVTGVEIRTDKGRVFQASVKAGWWAAWWPGAEGGEVDTLTVIVHTATGSTSHRPSDFF